MNKSLSRRQLLTRTTSVSLGILATSAATRLFAEQTEPLQPFKGEDIFQRILKKAQAGNWAKLPIGQCVGKIALEFVGIPYVGSTLELSPDQEICAVNLTGLDCVTFFEDGLDFARMLKTGGSTPQDLLSAVTFTRYRHGKIGDFTSRLHYTTDWWYDNENKGVIHDLSPDLPGAAPFTQKVGIMTQQPENYRQLKAHPELIPKIKKLEDEINARPKTFIPMKALPEAQKHLQTGDIVGVCTTEKGIDIAHTGLVYKDDFGIPHFMDACSIPGVMKVRIEKGPLAKTFNWSDQLTGAIFARPLEPKT